MKMIPNSICTCLLKDNKFESRVSSVLNKNTRCYGKQNMFAETNETCWNSDAGNPQWILINLENECTFSTLEIEFQGGFVGKDCHVEAGSSDKDLEVLDNFFPEDQNGVQKFHLKSTSAKTFKIVFNTSTDFFGRIIIYRLCVYPDTAYKYQYFYNSVTVQPT